jgi:hypothetical protein
VVVNGAGELTERSGTAELAMNSSRRTASRRNAQQSLFVCSAAFGGGRVAAVRQESLNRELVSADCPGAVRWAPIAAGIRAVQAERCAGGG